MSARTFPSREAGAFGGFLVGCSPACCSRPGLITSSSGRSCRSSNALSPLRPRPRSRRHRKVHKSSAR